MRRRLLTSRAHAAARRLIARLGPSGGTWKVQGRLAHAKGPVQRFWIQVQTHIDLNTPVVRGDGLDTATRMWLGSKRKKRPPPPKRRGPGDEGR